ncbi:uncharacterized protein LOC143237595 [Tachypleus tridentatus]|uniref:uncharacterized protein LOC143237595 n=1 Tax=Tachypleus tridentatus TaxID=6853 RepID=UPI003FD14FEF
MGISKLHRTGRILFLVVVLNFFVLESRGQFFTKISKVVPRLGRRAAPYMASRSTFDIARSLRHLVTFLRNNDEDGDGKLSLRELLASPLTSVFTAYDQESVYDQMLTNYEDSWADFEDEIVGSKQVPRAIQKE